MKLNEYEINVKNIKKVKRINNTLIISFDNTKRVYKESSNKKVYDYLSSKGFTNYLKPVNTIDNIDEFIYIDEVEIDDNDKAIDLIYLLAYLQNKTTSYEDINLDKLKEEYENTINKINYLYEYYYNLQDVIERKIYFSPSEYLLMRNISLIYKNLSLSKEYIDRYYEIVSNKKRIRKVFVHGKLELNHFLDNEEKLLISFKELKKDIPIYDFIYFYKTHYINLDMIDLFNIYQQKFEYNEEELLLLFSKLLIMDKIVIENISYNKYEKVKKMIEYIKSTNEFVLKENKKYKENKEKKF